MAGGIPALKGTIARVSVTLTKWHNLLGDWLAGDARKVGLEEVGNGKFRRYEVRGGTNIPGGAMDALLWLCFGSQDPIPRNTVVEPNRLKDWGIYR